MNRNLRRRGIVIAVVTIACVVILLGPWRKQKDEKVVAADFYRPSHLKKNFSENIKLGLDLRGGTHLVMQVQADDAIKAISEGNRQKAVDLLKKENVPVTDVKVPANGVVVVETPDTARHDTIRDKLLTDFGSADWEASLSTTPASVTFKLKGSAADRIRREATEQAKVTIEQRINQFGVAEPTIQLHGREEDHQILLQMPGVDNPDRVKELIKGTAILELKAVVPPATLYKSEEEAKATFGGEVPSDRQILRINETRGAGGGSIDGWYIVERTPIVAGNDLRDARGVPAQQGFGWRIAFNLKPAGADRFGAWTEKNIGNLLAIVLNDVIRSAPSIRDKITDSGEITGSFSQQEAEDLGLTLRSGALPAKIVYLEERTVGPSLGADSIRQGITASLVGLALVVGFMLFYYRFSGLNAVVGLLLNLVLLLAGLAIFGATLTLPGIAGVILTIGMAVDSNVLIFERIREELRAGKIVLSAMETGFGKALVTIIDTHVTTIVSAAFLYFFGTGPIRGFAVTLVIGLLANLFTAIYVSRTMFLWTLTRHGQRAETISI